MHLQALHSSNSRQRSTHIGMVWNQTKASSTAASKQHQPAQQQLPKRPGTLQQATDTPAQLARLEHAPSDSLPLPAPTGTGRSTADPKDLGGRPSEQHPGTQEPAGTVSVELVFSEQ